MAVEPGNGCTGGKRTGVVEVKLLFNFQTCTLTMPLQEGTLKTLFLRVNCST